MGKFYFRMFVANRGRYSSQAFTAVDGCDMLRPALYRIKEMKAITIICAIVFSLSAAWQASFLVQNISRYHYQPFIYAGQILGVLSQCCLAAFFFTLYSRQR